MKRKTERGGRVANYLALAIILAVLAGVFIGPVGPSNIMARRSSYMQTARAIGISLYAYAQAHQGHYPEGSTSTQIFQKLIDEKYVDDPAIFSVPFPGKMRSQTKQLKPENVSWDVTSCIDSSSPDNLPVVFFTGYKITYQAATKAEPVKRSLRTWSEWWNGPDEMRRFIAVCYLGNSARAIRADADGSIPNFIPADFDPKGKTYRQLTP